MPHNTTVWILYQNGDPSMCSVNKTGMYMQWGCRLRKNLKGWVGQGSPLHGSYLLRETMVPPCSMPLGSLTHLLAPGIPKGWAYPCGTQKNALQTLQMSNCFLSHFPSLGETRSNRSIDSFREDKECFNINIGGPGFDTDEATEKLLQSKVISLPSGIHHFEL